MGVIETQRLTKDFGAVLALDTLSVSVEDGVTGLVGANGAGKSTLIKILLGLLKPTSGSATVLGHDIAREGDAIRAKVGYMPEQDVLPPDVNAIDFVVHMGRMSGLPATTARERAADMLRHVGLLEERYRLMGGYSTGMKQRAKLAQALVHDPDLVLLDEPTNGLDPEAREEMLSLVSRIGHDFGIPVLVTSHLLGELERISDSVVIIDGGRLLRHSATAEFTQDTGSLAIEVVGDGDAQTRMGEALAACGLVARGNGALIEVEPHGTLMGDPLRDLIRDTALDLGLGLVRVQPVRSRIEDIFREADHGAA